MIFPIQATEDQIWDALNDAWQRPSQLASTIGWELLKINPFFINDSVLRLIGNEFVARGVVETRPASLSAAEAEKRYGIPDQEFRRVAKATYNPTGRVRKIGFLPTTVPA
jgi:hypothetical protein